MQLVLSYCKTLMLIHLKEHLFILIYFWKELSLLGGCSKSINFISSYNLLAWTEKKRWTDKTDRVSKVKVLNQSYKSAHPPASDKKRHGAQFSSYEFWYLCLVSQCNSRDLLLSSHFRKHSKPDVKFSKLMNLKIN